MGIISIIGMAFEVIKLVISLIRFIREMKKKDPAFNAADAVKQVNAAVAEYKKTGDQTALKQVEADLKKRCTGVGCPTGLAYE